MTEIVWLTISDLARRYGVRPQSMHERVRRLAARHEGLTRKSGRNVLVDVAKFEIAVEADGDAMRETAQQTRRLMDDDPDGAPTRDSRFRDAQTERALIDVRIKALELAKMQGELVAVDGAHGVQMAMRKVAERVSQRVAMIPRAAQAMHDAGLVSDQAAARRFLRDLVDEVMRKIAADMRVLSLDGQSAGASEGPAVNAPNLEIEETSA